MSLSACIEFNTSFQCCSGANFEYYVCVCACLSLVDVTLMSLILNIIAMLTVRCLIWVMRLAFIRHLCEYFEWIQIEQNISDQLAIIHERFWIKWVNLNKFAEHKWCEPNCWTIPPHCNHFSSRPYIVQLAFVHRAIGHGIRRASHHHR